MPYKDEDQPGSKNQAVNARHLAAVTSSDFSEYSTKPYPDKQKGRMCKVE